MKVDTNNKHLHAIVERIFIEGSILRNNDIDLYFVKPDGRLVYLYDAGQRSISVEANVNQAKLLWLDILDLSEETCRYSDFWAYSIPILYDEDPLYYIVARSIQNDLLLASYVYMTAELISHEFVHNRTVEKVFLKSEYQRAICEAVSHGYMTVDRFGVITYLNTNGAVLLNTSADRVIGKYMYDVLAGQDQLLNVLKTGQQWYHREFTIPIPKAQARLVFSALPIWDDRKQLVGAIFIFEKVKTVQKMYADMVGSHSIFRFEDVYYRSNAMEEVIQLAKTAAKTETTILIEGESGTGKELIAQAIHNYSLRSKGPFVVIDCSAIPRDLVESELFGYVDGAFTGARKGGRFGKFELANGGTVFLDEIGEMPLDMQAKLLRVIQSKTIARVGGSETIPVDFRIIAATNRNLEDEVKNGNFRLDLYYRIYVMHLVIPSLRERPEDIPYLVGKFIVKAAERHLVKAPELSQEALSCLINYSWPGNIRELENAVERTVVLSGETIEPRHLPKRIVEPSASGGFKATYELKPFFEKDPNRLQTAERQVIIKILTDVGWNKSLAAKQLGISRSTLYEKMKKYKID